ncbi:uncharacterized protein LOC115230359 [Octopus sinensis]|uniref:Uncharacterized protein LOC115230359 n=1 Tax=Octopus sinensis TaxID=2607531 RepID=A0A6P7TXE9_9MOLL|nr:uncharacterized protein LOC115230359 [Octopus sinensis]XP_036355522.1 uncharacterized protein LOC115230359 [Octopus sinensis]
MRMIKLNDIVFLGGSCNPSNWRKEIAIPYLNNLNISYYNPQVDNWTPDLVKQEDLIKKSCKCLLFVISEETRGIASMVEVAYLSSMKRHVILVMKDTFNFKTSTDNEQIELYKARKVIEEIMRVNNLYKTDNIAKALEQCVKTINQENVEMNTNLRDVNLNAEDLNYYDVYIYVSDDLSD